MVGGCGEDPVETSATEPTEKSQAGEPQPASPVVQPVKPIPVEAIPALPLIVVEDLDQAQEIDSVQMTSSFGVGEQGWQSYKASKFGYLTRFSLYGCAHTKNARNKNKFHYGETLWGEIRLARTKETLGTWTLSREEVVAQLKARGLKETQYDWIQVRISDDQRIPQIVGETYVIRSVKISDDRPFFGSFRCDSGDPYPDGEWWHRNNPVAGAPAEKDLVFRTYVGKTATQVIEERARRLEQVELRLQPKTPSPAPVVTITPPREVTPVPVPPVFPPREVTPAPVDPTQSIPPRQRPSEGNASKPGPKKPLLPFLPRK